MSLIELMVVIAVVGILAAIVISATAEFKHRALTAQSVSNLKSIGQGIQLYANDNGGELPLFCAGAATWSWGEPFWTDSILPYMGGKVDGGWRSPAGKRVETSPALMSPLVPAGKHSEFSDYAANRGVILFRAGRMTIGEIRNPASKVMVLSAVSKSGGGTHYFNSDAYWYSAYPPAFSSSLESLPSNHGAEGDVPLLFVDGHVEMMDKKTIWDKRSGLFLVNEWNN